MFRPYRVGGGVGIRQAVEWGAGKRGYKSYSAPSSYVYSSEKTSEEKYDISEAKIKDMTYSKPLRVNVKLVNKDTGEIILIDTKNNEKHSMVRTTDIDKFINTFTYLNNELSAIDLSHLGLTSDENILEIEYKKQFRKDAMKDYKFENNELENLFSRFVKYIKK